MEFHFHTDRFSFHFKKFALSIFLHLFIAAGNTLRFPRAAGELPRAKALRDLTEAFPPAGVFGYFLRNVPFPDSQLGNVQLSEGAMKAPSLEKTGKSKHPVCFVIRLSRIAILRLAQATYADSSGISTRPKIPQEAKCASEEAEAVPAESEVCCRSGWLSLSFLQKVRTFSVVCIFHECPQHFVLPSRFHDERSVLTPAGTARAEEPPESITCYSAVACSFELAAAISFLISSRLF